MENRPKNMPRWQWNKLIEEEERQRLIIEKSLEVPVILKDKKINDFIWGWVGFIILFVIIVFLINISTGDKPVTNECGEGYHLEGYTTAYGDTITDCFRN
jgi:hypothetical protein